jgi:energy-coupling factor transporter transmembrane protein EcfT
MRRSFSRAEDVTFALAARGYSDDIPLRFPSMPLVQMIPVLFLLVLFLMLK